MRSLANKHGAGQTEHQAMIYSCNWGPSPFSPGPSWSLTTYLPALNVRLQLLQGLQLLHLPLGLVDVGANSLHGLQGALYCRVVRVLAGRPLGQLLVWERTEKREIIQVQPGQK